MGTTAFAELVSVPAVNAFAMPEHMRDLAERMLPVYQEDNPERYLTNLSALQLAAGTYTVWDDVATSVMTVTIHGGQVTTAQWPIGRIP